MLQVRPAEVRAGVEQLDIRFTYDAQVAAYCLLQTTMGRRAPSIAALRWGDVRFVKQAVRLPDRSMVHVFGCALVVRQDKVIDEHNSSVIVLDASGDAACVNDTAMTPSMQLLNLAHGMGVIDGAALQTTPVGGEVPKTAGSDKW
jgi:hypothetical protein